MITEDYVSFETAKFLKEKGFNPLECGMYYSITTGKRTTELLTSLIACPTLQMAMKWLRKEHNLHIITFPYAPIDRPPYHPGEADIVYIAQIFRGIIPLDEVGRSIIKLTPEDTYEEAIKYCLENLI